MRLSTTLYMVGAVVLLAEWATYSGKLQNTTAVAAVGKLDQTLGGGTYRPGLLLVASGLVAHFAFGR